MQFIRTTTLDPSYFVRNHNSVWAEDSQWAFIDESTARKFIWEMSPNKAIIYAVSCVEHSSNAEHVPCPLLAYNHFVYPILVATKRNIRLVANTTVLQSVRRLPKRFQGGQSRLRWQIDWKPETVRVSMAPNLKGLKCRSGVVFLVTIIGFAPTHLY